ncbi:MAG: hypothetical protein PHE68_05705 [Candidatus Peribacteraceae bacterium]|nr:hypothetical protein [Candidatus Peribacteraceae bacterium]MDD5075143.1 hypothetical protein [Candidatus Peribacteraceae bacterium]
MFTSFDSIGLLHALGHIAMIPPAYADYQDAIEAVGSAVGGEEGGDLGEIYLNIMMAFLVIVNVVGMIMITKAGVMLAAKQGEDQIGAAKKTIGATAAALIILNLTPVLTTAISTLGEGGGTLISQEVIGLSDFIDTIAGSVAIVAIIISGIKAVTSYGGDEGTTHLKRTALAVIAGIIIIGAKRLIFSSVAESHTPGGLLEIIVTVVNIVLSLGALLATTAIIYAGLLMVVNFGKDEQYTRAKNLIVRVGIGLVVILSSAAIVNLVIAS